MSRARSAEPFPLLHRRLLRRRLARFDLTLRIEILLLAGIIGAFVFWQARVPLDGLVRANGPLACLRALAVILGALAVATGLLVAVLHARRLRAPLPGPAWLALPLTPRQIADHFAWDARWHAAWAAALAPSFLIAAVGLVPWGWLAALALGFALALWGCARLGAAIATRQVFRGRPRGGVPDRALEILTQVPATSARARVGPARWRRVPAWLALWLKDVRLCLRPTRARARLALPIVFLLASCLVWVLPPSTDHELFSVAGLRFFAFAAVLLAAMTFAELLIELAGADPHAVIHALPLDAKTVWWSRAASALLFALVLAAGQAVSARPLAPMALGVLLVWLIAAALAIHLLGVHYGITIPNATAAQHFLTLSLGIAIAASLMIPLVGWIVLLTAVIHSARRVPRWTQLEAER